MKQHYARRITMRKKYKIKRPKTHSEILWHFTGGAQWNKKYRKQSKKLKPMSKSFEAFIGILKSQILRVGSYHEIINCTVLKDKSYNNKTNRFEIKNNVTRTVSTSPVCCVADIPLTELFHHAKRYGKIAIGFKRSSLIDTGFNPVFYTLHNAKIILNFYNAQNALQQSDCGIEDAISDIESSLSEIGCGHTCDNGNSWEPDENHCSHDIDTSDLSSVADDVRGYMEEALSDLGNTLAFIKTFDRSEFDTIYSEREWRSIASFKFKWRDVAALILPEKNGYYKKFVQTSSKSLKLPKSIKLYRWEDIDSK